MLSAMSHARTRGSEVRRYRRTLGETQSAFATACGIEVYALSRVERGRGNFGLTVTMRVVRRLRLVGFDVTVEDLTDLVDKQGRVLEPVPVTRSFREAVPA